MSIVPKLASVMGERGDEADIRLAEAIVKKQDRIAVQELVSLLHDKNKNIQSDCIKTLDEIGYRDATLLSPHLETLLLLLDHKNNRLVWGAMAALDPMATLHPEVFYKKLPRLLAIAAAGSVITRDRLVNILARLGAFKKYREEMVQLLLEQLKSAPQNQLPRYAEQTLPLLGAAEKKSFINTLNKRLPEMESLSKKKRLEKVLKQAMAEGSAKR